jgi:hypothetical protein
MKFPGMLLDKITLHPDPITTLVKLWVRTKIVQNIQPVATLRLRSKLKLQVFSVEIHKLRTDSNASETDTGVKSAHDW